MSKSKLASEITGAAGKFDAASWAARFAELQLAEQLAVVRECREHAAEPPKKRSKEGGRAVALWEANFVLRSSPAWQAAARQVARELDPPDAPTADADDERSRALQSDRDWVQARTRRGFVLDGSPGAWRPAQGTPAAAASGAARTLPDHSPVSRGAWQQSKLMADSLLRSDSVRRNRLSMEPGERAKKW
jgi:hypothetical protein